MNYLVHLYLSEPTAASQLGSLLGDFVKGPLDDRYSPAITAGIRRHRQVDVFAHHDPAFRRSRERLDPRFGLCRGIMVDVFYDHFLARDWESYHPQPLEDYAAQVYRLLEAHFELLPHRLQQIVPHMTGRNWLVSYRQAETMRTVLQRMAGRLRQPTPLAEGYAELQRHYAGLEEDFRRFLAAARAHLACCDAAETADTGD